MVEPPGPPPSDAGRPIDPADATLIATDGPVAPLGASATIVDPRSKSAARPPAGAADRRRGDTLGRYVVLGALGQGGMGVVFAAYDPELERKVAIKILLDRKSVDETEGRAWLFREAQAMAQLAHPNVVGIHDVGAVDGPLYIAMEYVEGETLGEWLKTPRRWREILEIFLQAGEGLQAAHAAGLVHRDFKADNVMISADGRARVMDFGLARADRAQPSPRPLQREAQSALDSVLTRAGAIMGTPRYMAPEQWAGEVADARSDLFSFCVALWEALHGAHPFRGESIADLAIAVTGGRVQPPPPGTRVPARIRRALARGLASQPHERWPSMRALLDELARDPTPARRRWLAAGVLGLGLALGLGGWRVERAAKIDACAREGATIREVWNADASLRAHEAIIATGIPSVAVNLASIDRKLDRFAAQWAETRERACVDATVEDDVDDDTYGRIVRCLEEQRDEAASLIETFTRADKAVALRGAAAAASLRPPALCTDRSWLGPYGSISASLAGPAGALRRAFARVSALVSAGEFDEAARTARAAHDLAERLGIPLLLARADLSSGSVAQRRGDSLAAREALEAAYFRAGSLGADELASDAAARLTFVVGYRLAEPTTGRMWARLADMALARLDVGEADYRRAVIANGRGVIELASGEDAEAERELREVLRIAEAHYGPEHPSVAGALGNIGTMLWARGAYDEALALHRRSLEIRISVLGAEHPDVATDLNNIGANLQALGRVEEAVAIHERALKIRLESFGPESNEVGETLDNLCTLYLQINRGAESEATCRRAIEIRDRTFGPKSPHSGYARIGLITLERMRLASGHAAEADRVIASIEEAFGPDNPDIAGPLNMRGWIALEDEHDPETALALAERSRQLASRGTTRTEGVISLALIGEAELALGRPLDAASTFSLALEDFAGREGADVRIASGLRFGLARALIALGRDPAGAQRLAIEARQDLADFLAPPLFPADALRLLEIDAWIRTHPPGT
ncbi:MAG: serine/threonine-protein kinase [Nannocystaceae bacterium]